MFVKVYNELIESGEYPILPEFIIFEVLKSHPSRMYLLKYDKIYDVPFGVMALLNDKEFLIKKYCNFSINLIIISIELIMIVF